MLLHLLNVLFSLFNFSVSLLPELDQSAATGILLTDKLQLPLRYAAKLLWPVDLNHIYFTPELNAWYLPLTFASCILILALVFLIFRWLRLRDIRGPLLAIGCSLMLPYMHLKTGVVYMADRYLFLALPFFALTLTLSVNDSTPWRALAVRWRRGLVVLILLLMTLAGATPHGAFRDSVSLWTRMTVVYDRSDWGFDRLGRALYHQGEYEASAGAWLKAWEIRPGTTKHLNNAAVSAMALGRNQMAIDLLRRVIQIDPENSRARENLQIAREALGEPPREEREGAPSHRSSESENR